MSLLKSLFACNQVLFDIAVSGTTLAH